MKTLSVKQPWANLLAFHFKWFECRTWFTKHRGPTLIHASLRDDRNATEYWGGCVDSEPRGHVIAAGDLYDCRYMRIEDEHGARVEYRKDTVVFQFVNVRRIKPIPLKGQLGIFESGITEDQLEYLE